MKRLRIIFSLYLIVWLTGCAFLKPTTTSTTPVSPEVVQIFAATKKASPHTQHKVNITEKEQVFLSRAAILNAQDFNAVSSYHDKFNNEYLVFDLPLEAIVKISKLKGQYGWVLKYQDQIISAAGTLSHNKKRFIFRVKDHQVSQNVIKSIGK
ncbi:hypothetical protein [Basilea psittacipulmonis]|uniref:Lipoprotein n=1 Tax=Basilea psittacipulmonis DSM 24701 TaxID=1072685 RepID=A0A077DEZ5_9BURK|nr:hypothetical protein [Basilea psittacipulmonis]AIL32706.1 hypothetical protein IX83_04735 [Basilea psittacipulmonis DSM 24701]